MKVTGAKDGNEVALPPGLDAIIIETRIGGIYIDLNGPVPDMVLVRAVARDAANTRLILSPMNERMAMGVIKSP
jgi:hypothetical protein